MAFSKILIAVAAIASLAIAAPLKAPRDVTSVVTETAWTTIDVPVTLWVDESGKPIRTEVPAQAGNFAEKTSSPVLQSSALSSITTIISHSTPTAPAAKPATVVPTTTAAPSSAPAVTTSRIVASQNVAPASSQQFASTSSTYSPPVYSSSAVVPSASASYTAPSAVSTNIASSGSDVCQGVGSGCTGDITHWDGGLGACGWNVNTATDFQIAMPVGLMGAQSNGNPYCGKSLTIKNPNTGATVQATVGDKCMGCVGDSIDLTDALFAAIGGGCDGRCSGFSWWFN